MLWLKLNHVRKKGPGNTTQDDSSGHTSLTNGCFNRRPLNHKQSVKDELPSSITDSSKWGHSTDRRNDGNTTARQIIVIAWIVDGK